MQFMLTFVLNGSLATNLRILKALIFTLSTTTDNLEYQWNHSSLKKKNTLTFPHVWITSAPIRWSDMIFKYQDYQLWTHILFIDAHANTCNYNN